MCKQHRDEDCPTRRRPDPAESLLRVILRGFYMGKAEVASYRRGSEESDSFIEQ